MTDLPSQCENRRPASSTASDLVGDTGGPAMATMEIGGILNGRNPMADAHMRHQFQHSMQMNHPVYGLSHSQMIPPHNPQHAMNQPNVMGYSSMPSLQQDQMIPSYIPRHPNVGVHDPMDPHGARPRSEPAAKAFACSTCQKKFARRSDLARHERIHSGIRPHACEHPGCGKQFIQRSALTVHARVHTGEKPHMCERCGKPFSDSSSLARHRRIHSGKRPYKCPFANCQKTFTRRTTLTRHQNHHSGTLEQAQAETNALLSQSTSQPQSAHSSYSDGTSRQSATSPVATSSISPPQDVAAMQNMQKQNSDFSYMPHQNQPHASQMRNDYHSGARRNQPQYDHSPIANYNGTTHHRNVLTSHPTRFAPTQPPEASIVNGVGVSASPHMPGMTWSTNPNGIQNPVNMDPYPYQDQQFNAMYYPDGNIRRPQSTEPQDGVYGMPVRSMNHPVPTGNIHNIPTDWGGMSMHMHHDVKPERGYA